MSRINEFVEIPKCKVFNHKRYELRDSFVSLTTANTLKAKYKKMGYNVRIHQKGGVMHFLNRYHVYVRKGK